MRIFQYLGWACLVAGLTYGQDAAPKNSNAPEAPKPSESPVKASEAKSVAKPSEAPFQPTSDFQSSSEIQSSSEVQPKAVADKPSLAASSESTVSAPTELKVAKPENQSPENQESKPAVQVEDSKVAEPVKLDSTQRVSNQPSPLTSPVVDSVPVIKAVANPTQADSLEQTNPSKSEISAKSVAPLDSAKPATSLESTESTESTKSIDSNAVADKPFNPKNVKLNPQANTPAVVQPVAKPVVIDSVREARRKKILGSVKVSKIQTAKDLGDGYKSPKKALFYSLVLPGAGQFYVGNSGWIKARGAGYLIAEALLWTGFYHYTVDRYESKNTEARKFVQRNYDLDEYESNTFQIRNQAVGSDGSADSIFTRRYLSQREDFCEAVFGSDFANAESSCSSLSANQNYRDWDRIAEFEELAILLERDDFVLGWDDAEVTELELQLDKNTYVELGQSELLAKYRKKRQEARDYADMQPLFITGILLNHIVSAVDAAWSAHAYNQSKVQKKLAWQERVHLQSSWAPNLDRGVQWQGFLQASYSF